MLDGKGWECSSCNEQQKLSRNCSLDIEDKEEIEYVEDTKFINVRYESIEKNKFAISADKYRYHICPVGIADEDTVEMLRTFSMCKEFKCLPCPGAYYEQDNRLISTFELINIQINRHEQKEIERSNKEMKKQSGSKI